MSDDYICTLDDKTAKKAKDELHEDPKERISQVETLRKWIKQQPHIRCPTGKMSLCLECQVQPKETGTSWRIRLSQQVMLSLHAYKINIRQSRTSTSISRTRNFLT